VTARMKARSRQTSTQVYISTTTSSYSIGHSSSAVSLLRMVAKYGSRKKQAATQLLAIRLDISMLGMTLKGRLKARPSSLSRHIIWECNRVRRRTSA